MGSILIFISIFLEWAIVTHIIFGNTTYEYGYDRPLIIILLSISFIPIILYELKKRFTYQYLAIPVCEFIVFSFSLPAYVAIYSVETGIGLYFALVGIFFQFIGIVVAIIIEWIKRKYMHQQLTAHRKSDKGAILFERVK